MMSNRYLAGSLLALALLGVGCLPNVPTRKTVATETPVETTPKANEPAAPTPAAPEAAKTEPEENEQTNTTELIILAEATPTLVQSDHDDTTSTIEEPKKIIIEMSSKGFSIETLKIHKGETVSFFNADSIAHWPASNPHPTHHVYSEFDSKSPVAPGKSYNFTFMRLGRWQYHDHLHPSLRGTIEVSE